ncbi:hypothetical protein K4F52_010333 [Lecanicillium sp. MT-2017a]|nr:hypothetical protein K4F52_010333 [Lecanicillium sp. MT-2017a]
MASLKAEGVSVQSEWAADSAINDWDMLPCTISENDSQNVSCGLANVDYGRDITDEALDADMACYAEQESEAASLLMQLPNARQVAESPQRALSITELIL